MGTRTVSSTKRYCLHFRGTLFLTTWRTRLRILPKGRSPHKSPKFCKRNLTLPTLLLLSGLLDLTVMLTPTPKPQTRKLQLQHRIASQAVIVVSARLSSTHLAFVAGLAETVTILVQLLNGTAAEGGGGIFWGGHKCGVEGEGREQNQTEKKEGKWWNTNTSNTRARCCNYLAHVQRMLTYMVQT